MHRPSLTVQETHETQETHDAHVSLESTTSQGQRRGVGERPFTLVPVLELFEWEAESCVSCEWNIY